MNHGYGIWAFVLTACGTVSSGAGAAPAQGDYYYEGGTKHAVTAVTGLVATTDADTAQSLKVALPQAEVVHAAGITTVFRASSADVAQALGTASAKVSAVYQEGTSGLGGLMALPGGVLVNFKPDWTEAQARTWVSARGFVLGQKLNLPGNWYLVATPAGAASLLAANAMFESGAVLSATPNWWKQASTR